MFKGCDVLQRDNKKRRILVEMYTEVKWSVLSQRKIWCVSSPCHLATQHK